MKWAFGAAATAVVALTPAVASAQATTFYLDRLFMAGRCLSCSHEAQASIRVIGTCFATGEAAGLAAALAVSQGDVTALAVRAARVHVMQ